jgi:type VI secretion system secreted protein VgrG
MADAIKQTDRLMSLSTPAGADVLCMENANITERISKPFAMQFDLLAEKSKKSSIKYDQLLGNNVTLTVRLPGEKKRYFCGMVSRFSEAGEDERFAYYRLEAVPWLWLLTLTTDCKVFQDKTVPEIIEDVFKEWQGKYSQVVHFENKTSGSFTKLDYCVQYRETDFNFVSRLMEQEGIFYYFKHEDGKHTLVMSNDASSLEACPNLAQARYLPESGMGEWEDGVLTLDNVRSIVPGKVTLGDYHFQMSNKTLRESSSGSVKVASNDNLEIFDYPGEYSQRFNKPDERLGDVEKNGGDLAKWRMEEQSGQHLQISGTSSCRAFTTGYYFSLLGKDSAQKKLPGTAGKYVLNSLKHSIQQTPDYISGGEVAQPYRNTFTCVPREVKYRSARSTPRPVVQGMQTAVVVGLKGEEIDCDKYGRVKVQFHWDREGKKDEKSSCWVRVASLLAGKEWGMVHIPRIGQEVVVAFLEGDPDQPLIVGSVYNYDNMPPYKLPDNKTQSGLKTRSTKQGSSDNFNELRFEDKKGSEEVYFHAEKDFNRVVENNDTLKVGFDKKDKGDQTIEIFNNQTIKVGNAQASDGSQTLEVWKDRTHTLKTGNDTLSVKQGDRSATIEMGNDALTLKMGNQTTKLDLGQSSTEAMQSITLKVGQSSVTIDQTGVTIKGMMVSIQGQMQTQVTGTMTQLQGSAMLQASGGIMMIG